jgi:undecaprenyl-diphosphatase
LTTLETVILGIVEGLTEFLPISSTGHLILVSNLLGIQQTEQHKAFEVSIQLGSILAVVFLYFKKFLDTNLMKRILIAFIPTGILGFVLYKIIKSLFNPYIVVFMLIFGGLLLILIELYHKNKSYDINSIYEVSYQKAFLIGVFQSLAMIPGTSRSGATIVGGLLLGLNRKTAAEFSFMLAVPTMFMATFYDAYKNHSNFNLSDWENLIVGFTVAFISALFAIKWLLKFISNHSFILFGIYRIILGILYYFIVLR